MDWALPVIDKQKCVICGDCAEICPTGALSLLDKKIIFQNPRNCTFCTLCEQICPQKAIRCEFTITTGERKG
ncbi:MAG: 4Fe-4S dicluster domain-containing protein [Anaerolineaceae bacterium]|jgi:ferredoxin|nr:MAG: 4Fe-4S dicluster domain-containing protein [Anaerolineaceae bacterium]